MPNVAIQVGLPEALRSDAARLYDEAFGAKLAVAVRADQERLALIEGGLMPAFAIVALHGQELAGIAGFHTSAGSLTGGIDYSDLIHRLGPLQGNWAAVIFALYERKPAPGDLLMDGIAVSSAFRGQGIGGRLLDTLFDYGRTQGFERVRLDVIDINPRAKALYERKGFVAVKTETFPYLRWLLGFGGVTTMEKTLDPQKE